MVGLEAAVEVDESGEAELFGAEGGFGVVVDFGSVVGAKVVAEGFAFVMQRTAGEGENGVEIGWWFGVADQTDGRRIDFGWWMKSAGFDSADKFDGSGELGFDSEETEVARVGLGEQAISDLQLNQEYGCREV